MKMDLLHAGTSDSLDVLNADMMEAICGGDLQCKRNYRARNVFCKLNYEVKDDGTISCQRRYRRTN